MPVGFIFAMVILAIAVVSAVVWFKVRDDAGPMPAITTGLFVAMGVVLAIASMNSVPIRNVGIVTSWNKPTGETTGAGFKVTMPWENIEDWDASRQAYDHRGGNDCVNVRIATLSNACVEVLIEWQVHEDKAPEQWASYKKDFSLFVGRRIDPAMQDAMNTAFASYDPLANVDKATGNLNVPTGPLAETVKMTLQRIIGEDVQILTVAIPRVNHDEKTQASIDAYQQAINRSRVLDQEKENAEKQKAITETNAKVDSVTRCLELADKHGKEPGFCLGTGNPVQQR